MAGVNFPLPRQGGGRVAPAKKGFLVLPDSLTERERVTRPTTVGGGAARRLTRSQCRR